MKPSLYLLIPALFLVSCDQQEVVTQQVEPNIESLVPITTLAAPDNYDDCITQTMQGVSSDIAARAIIESCQNQFPSESTFAFGVLTFRLYLGYTPTHALEISLSVPRRLI
jgi:hypothetical protein|tara:strand:+ start:90 stop:422 length:333 start_codon:yes stop_codon:yes gene_type:complete